MKKAKKPICNFVIGLDFDKEDAEIARKAAINGNMQAKLDIIMHNQFVLNYKLSKITDSK